MKQIPDTSKHAMGVLTCGTHKDVKATCVLGDLKKYIYTVIKDSH